MSTTPQRLTPEQAAAFHEQVAVEPLSEKHRGLIAAFKCHDVIDKFLKNDALQWSREGLTRAWLFLYRGVIVGYMTLSTNIILIDQAERAGLKVVTERKEWPAVLIGMLGVHKDFQGGGRELGDFLLQYAIGQAELVAEIAAAKFIVADVYNDPYALDLYKRNGFTPSRYKDYQGKERIKHWRALNSNPPIEELPG
jgi:ribosomal protein S18 acetylase RimI-like enzyme